ncbi:MAG TPA: SAM-dependent methyltransferase [Baekduia sp.]|nr:SAM-dependent methyltransferase [Baekduia sp.]
MPKPRLIRLEQAVATAFPDLADPGAAIRDGRVEVAGTVRDNPATMVARDAPLLLDRKTGLRGTRKLAPALERFPVRPEGAVALDAGASAGGFTQALLDAGAARVYAVDVGFGQLVGTLRQRGDVVVLERTNVADLDPRLVPDAVDVATLDLGYLALAEALPQLERLRWAPGARLVALVKPMFELRLADPPEDEPTLLAARDAAAEGARRAGWSVEDWIHSPVTGSRGARELFLFAVRAG